MKERRRIRRGASPAALKSVAAAPSFKAAKKRSKLTPAGLLLAAIAMPKVMIMTAIPVIIGGMMLAVPRITQAGTLLDTPEIDPSSMAGALTLLVGGILVLTDRNRRV